MKSKLSLVLAAAALAVVVSPARAGAQSLAGLWDATITMNSGSLEIPFRFELAGSGSTIKGSFFNGDEKSHLDDRPLRRTARSVPQASTEMRHPRSTRTLEGRGQLEETGAAAAATPYPCSQAERFVPVPRRQTRRFRRLQTSGSIQVGKSSKGEAPAWQIDRQAVRPECVRRDPARRRRHRRADRLNTATARFVLSHFSGARPARVSRLTAPARRHALHRPEPGQAA